MYLGLRPCVRYVWKISESLLLILKLSKDHLMQVERNKLNKYGRPPYWDVLLNLNWGYPLRIMVEQFMNVSAVDLILPKMMRT